MACRYKIIFRQKGMGHLLEWGHIIGLLWYYIPGCVQNIKQTIILLFRQVPLREEGNCHYDCCKRDRELHMEAGWSSSYFDSAGDS